MSTSSVTSSMNVADSPAARAATVTAIPAPAAIEGQKLRGAVGTDNVTSGMSVGSQLPAPVATQTDHKNLVSGADFRKGGDYAKAAMDKIANPPNPREQMGQFPLSGRTPAAPAPITTVDDTEVGG